MVGMICAHHIFLQSEETSQAEMLVSELFECECEGLRKHISLSAPFLVEIGFVAKFNQFFKKVIGASEQKTVPEAVWSIKQKIDQQCESIHLDDFVEVLTLMLKVGN